jgi:hypothetical protein
MRRFAWILMLALGGAASGCYVEGRPAAVAPGGYVLLGERWVHGGGQAVHEGIGGLRRDGRFVAIRLVVQNAPVELYDVAITFGNGEIYRPGTRLSFGPGTETREIPLAGGTRFIRRVDFVLANVPGDGKALVQLWAR